MSAINHNHAIGNELGNMVSYGLGGHRKGGGYIRHRLGQKANAKTRSKLGGTAGRMVGAKVAGYHYPSGFNRRMARRHAGRSVGNSVANKVNGLIDKIH